MSATATVIIATTVLCLVVALVLFWPKPQAPLQKVGVVPDKLYTDCIGPDPGIPLWQDPGPSPLVGRIALCSEVEPYERRVTKDGIYWMVKGKSPGGSSQQGWMQDGYLHGTPQGDS